MATGKVKWFDAKKGFGFITPALQAAGVESVNDGQAVTYELTEQRGKEAASEIQLT